MLSDDEEFADFSSIVPDSSSTNQVTTAPPQALESSGQEDLGGFADFSTVTSEGPNVEDSFGDFASPAATEQTGVQSRLWVIDEPTCWWGEGLPPW